MVSDTALINCLSKVLKLKEFNMAKKTLLLLGFIFIISFEIFPQNLQFFYVGDYSIMTMYEGKNNAVQVYNRYKGQGTLTEHKASQQFMEWIKQGLNRFVTARGDVYSINITTMADVLNGYIWICICEFTSNSNFNYWFYLFKENGF
jgi:hypothetical protein